MPNKIWRIILFTCVCVRWGGQTWTCQAPDSAGSPCCFSCVVQAGEVKKGPVKPHLEEHRTRGGKKALSCSVLLSGTCAEWAKQGGLPPEVSVKGRTVERSPPVFSLHKHYLWVIHSPSELTRGYRTFRETEFIAQHDSWNVNKRMNGSDLHHPRIIAEEKNSS